MATSPTWTQISPTFSPTSDRIHSCVQGRYVTVFRTRSHTLHCLDSTCYHAGGPLGIGDLEDVNGEACITCPWHAYPVVLKDGAKLYESLVMDPVTRKLTPGGWARKPHAQRVHEVQQKPDGSIWVRLNAEGKFDSDEYGTSVVCGERVAKGDKSGAVKGRDGRMPRSGAVFQGTTTGAKKMTEWTTVKVAAAMTPEGSTGFRIRFVGGPGTHRDGRMMLLNAADLLETRHLNFRVTPTAEERSYTLLPIEMCDPVGESATEFQLCVRLYPSRVDATSTSLSRLTSGAIVHVSKPVMQSSNTTELRALNLSPQAFSHILLFAAGSGITAISSVLINCVEHTLNSHITLICVDSDEGTCLLRGNLSKYVMTLNGKRRVRVCRVWTSSKERGVGKPGLGEDIVMKLGHRLDEATLVGMLLKPELAAIKAGDKILVAGCGPSGFFLEIAGWVGHAVKATGAEPFVVDFW